MSSGNSRFKKKSLNSAVLNEIAEFRPPVKIIDNDGSFPVTVLMLRPRTQHDDITQFDKEVVEKGRLRWFVRPVHPSDWKIQSEVIANADKMPKQEEIDAANAKGWVLVHGLSKGVRIRRSVELRSIT